MVAHVSRRSVSAPRRCKPLSFSAPAFPAQTRSLIQSELNMLDFLKTFPTHMDFEGQKLAEKIFQLIIAASAVIGFAVGNYNQRFSYTVYILGIGFVLCCLVTLPPWSFYRKHPLSWLKAVVLVEENAEGNTSQQKTKQKKK